MLDPLHVRDLIIIPALTPLPDAMVSDAAVALLLGTALKESGLRYLKQGVWQEGDGQGRALGIYQMEPATYQDHLRYLSRHPALMRIILPHGIRPATDMLWDWRLATQMARLHYWYRSRAALPAADDVEGLARYWGKVWQTQSIPLQIQHFVELYRRYVTGVA